MARIRTVKPDIARHEELFALEQETGLPMRFAWTMLFTVCDKEGRFKWRPAVLKLDVLPFDDLDFSRVLHAWLTRGFLVKYRISNEWYGCIPTWRKHQIVNNKETASVLPGLDEAEEVYTPEIQQLPDACPTRAPRVSDATCMEGEGKGKGREREGKGNSVSSELQRVVITFTLNDKTEFEITEKQVQEWVDLFPGIDVMQQLRAIKAWCQSNPANRKTRRGALRFASGWLSRQQNKAPRVQQVGGGTATFSQPGRPHCAASGCTMPVSSTQRGQEDCCEFHSADLDRAHWDGITARIQDCLPTLRQIRKVGSDITWGGEVLAGTDRINGETNAQLAKRAWANIKNLIVTGE